MTALSDIPAGSHTLKYEDSRPVDPPQYLDAFSYDSSCIPSSPYFDQYQPSIALKTPNRCLVEWETPSQTTFTPSFLDPDAYSTPRAPYELPISSHSPPVFPDEVESISDEDPSSDSDARAETTSTPMKTSISNFDLIGTLGCGAYGKVLLGRLEDRPKHSTDLHAIKVLRKGDMSRFGVEEVKRELRTLRWVADFSSCRKTESRGARFLQKMKESFQNDDYVFIVLEYHPVSLSNPDISTRVRLRVSQPSRRLSASASLPSAFSTSYGGLDSLSNLRLVASELVLALLFLHRNGIIHQDVKPENVMVSAEGHIVLSDFGASAVLPSSVEYEDFPVDRSSDSIVKKIYRPLILQGNDIVTFTPRYAAPELLRRNERDVVVYDERVDWFSFGVLLYVLATGSFPFLTDFQASEPTSRRSEGDFSLAFGELEKLELASATSERGLDGSLKGSSLEPFLKALLVHQPDDRLSGEDVKHHPFFDPISTLWDEISDMCHPPLPAPPLPSIQPDVSFSMPSGSLRPSASLVDSFAVSQVLKEAGLHVTWPTLHRGGRRERKEREMSGSETSREARNGSVSNGTSAGISGRNSHCSPALLSSHSCDILVEDMSEVQPFPSTASIMFLPNSEYHSPPDILSPPSGTACEPPKVSCPRPIRSLIPSFCSVHDSGVDISCDADVSSSMEAGMSTNIDFEDVDTTHAASIEREPLAFSDRSSFQEVQDLSAFSPTPTFEDLLSPRCPSIASVGHQCHHQDTSSSAHRPSTNTNHLPIPLPPCEASLIRDDESVATSAPRFSAKAKSSTMPRDRRLSASPQTITPPRSTAVRRNVVRPLIPPLSRSALRDRPSLPATVGPSTSQRSRRSSLPSSSSPRHKTEGHRNKRNSFAECQTAYRGIPSEFGYGTPEVRRSRGMPESWTLEEELTISVLNAMHFPRVADHSTCDESGRIADSPRTRRDSQLTQRARRATLSVIGSIRRRDRRNSHIPTREPSPPVATVPPETPQLRQRRLSVLSRKQSPQKDPLSTPEAAHSSPRKSLGKFFKKLKRLSGF